jgi:PucR family transcriptional regulator, purine catabolism regulatory protein
VSGPVTVRELLAGMSRWGAQVIAGEAGLGAPVSWASVMRAQLPAFQDVHRGEVVLLSLATVQALADRGAPVSLPAVIEQLADLGATGALIAGISPASALPPAQAAATRELRTSADALGLPVIALPQHAPLADLRGFITDQIMERQERQGFPLEPVDAYAAQIRASLRGEALDALLAGAYAGEAQMRLRARQLGYDLTQPHAVVWIELSAPPKAGRRESPPDPALASALADALGLGLGAWAQTRPPDQVVALLPLLSDHGPQEALLERVAALITRTAGDARARRAPEWAAGLGDPATAPAHIRRSATEAHDAARLGRIVLGPRHIARPGDLGVYRLLLALREHGDLEPFIRRTLEPLLRDERHGDTLIETLEAFFACNGNSTRAAEALHLHRNSLLYRLNQAKELLGQDLDDPETRLALQLAIKGLRVMRLQEERDAYAG